MTSLSHDGALRNDGRAIVAPFLTSGERIDHTEFIPRTEASPRAFVLIVLLPFVVVAGAGVWQVVKEWTTTTNPIDFVPAALQTGMLFVFFCMVAAIALIPAGNRRRIFGSPPRLCAVTDRRILVFDLVGRDRRPSLDVAESLAALPQLTRLGTPGRSDLYWAGTEFQVRVHASAGRVGRRRDVNSVSLTGVSGAPVDLSGLERAVVASGRPAVPPGRTSTSHLSPQHQALLAEVLHPEEVPVWCSEAPLHLADGWVDDAVVTTSTGRVRPMSPARTRIVLFVVVVVVLGVNLLKLLQASPNVATSPVPPVALWIGLVFVVLLLPVLRRRAGRQEASGACAIYAVTNARAVIAQWDEHGRILVETFLPPHLAGCHRTATGDVILSRHPRVGQGFPLPQNVFRPVADLENGERALMWLMSSTGGHPFRPPYGSRPA